MHDVRTCRLTLWPAIALGRSFGHPLVAATPSCSHPMQCSWERGPAADGLASGCHRTGSAAHVAPGKDGLFHRSGAKTSFFIAALGRLLQFSSTEPTRCEMAVAARFDKHTRRAHASAIDVGAFAKLPCSSLALPEGSLPSVYGLRMRGFGQMGGAATRVRWRCPRGAQYAS